MAEQTVTITLPVTQLVAVAAALHYAEDIVIVSLGCDPEVVSALDGAYDAVADALDAVCSDWEDRAAIADADELDAFLEA